MASQWRSRAIALPCARASAPAIVLDVRFEVDAELPLDGEDWEKGEAVGTYCVEHPEGSFRQSFRLWAPWAVNLQAGDAITVVVHHSKRKVFLNLGVESSPGVLPRAATSHSVWHQTVERSGSAADGS